MDTENVENAARQKRYVQYGRDIINSFQMNMSTFNESDVISGMVDAFNATDNILQKAMTQHFVKMLILWTQSYPTNRDEHNTAVHKFAEILESHSPSFE